MDFGAVEGDVACHAVEAAVCAVHAGEEGCVLLREGVVSVCDGGHGGLYAGFGGVCDGEDAVDAFGEGDTVCGVFVGVFDKVCAEAVGFFGEFVEACVEACDDFVGDGGDGGGDLGDLVVEDAKVFFGVADFDEEAFGVGSTIFAEFDVEADAFGDDGAFAFFDVGGVDVEAVLAFVERGVRDGEGDVAGGGGDVVFQLDAGVGFVPVFNDVG